MSEIIRIRLDDQEAHDIEVKTYEEITVEEYIRIADGHNADEAPHETLSRVFSVPSRIARVMKMHEIYGVMGAYAKLLEDGKAAWAKAHDIRALLKKEDEETKVNWTAERAKQLLAEASIHRYTIEVEGQEFQVAQDIDAEGNYGQYLDLQVASDMECSESARLPHLLAIYCLKKGEGYGPEKMPGESLDDHRIRWDAWKDARIALFHKARMVDAQAVAAFFFFSSSVFRETTRHRLSYLEALTPPLRKQEPESTPSGGEPTPN